MPIELQNITHDPNKYKEIFEDALGNKLYRKVQEFFNYLFVDDCPERPLDNRCYIVITRKGFSLWLAGMLCGMTGKSIPTPDRLISDRNWNKMTVSERISFIKDKDVYIADDSVITGASAQSIYLGIDVDPRRKRAKSRNIAFLTSEFRYDYSKMFQTYKDFGAVTPEQRREANEKILFALYKLAIPFTAEAPSYHIQMRSSDFDKWKNHHNGWVYKDTPLDFGRAGTIRNTGFFQAPLDNDKFGANVLLRGMRVCFREFFESGETYVDVFLVPWIIFDAFNYDDAINYLLEHVKEDLPNYTETWLYDQLTNGEPRRIQTVVHRVISYLYDCRILEEFENQFVDGQEIPLFTLPNGVKLEQYHFGGKLLEEISILKKEISHHHKCPAECLRMDAEQHDDLASALCSMSYYQLEIPKTRLPAIELEDKLCSQREIIVDKKTGIPIYPSRSKRHPLICYKEDRSYIVLSLIRRSIASFHSDIISYKGRTYLIKTLLPGEGSPIAFIKNYDFIFALHHFASTDQYSRGKEKRFAKEWNELSITETLSPVSDTMIDTLQDMSSAYWPSKKTIMEALFHVDPYKIIAKGDGGVDMSAIDHIICIADNIANKINEACEVEENPLAFLAKLHD